MATDGADWRRLGEYVIRRRTQLGITQGDIRARGGPATATMRLLEGGLQDSYRPVILARLEAALGWASGSVDAILAGGEPTLASRSPQPPLQYDDDDAVATLREIDDVVRSKFSDSTVRRAVTDLIDYWKQGLAEAAADLPAEPDRRSEAG